MKNLHSKLFFTLFFYLLATAANVSAEWVLPPIDVSEPGGSASFPKICYDDTGTAFIVWNGFRGLTSVVQVSLFDGSTFSTPFDLSDVAKNAFGPRICCDNNGNATAIWYSDNGSFDTVQVSFYDQGTDSWSARQSISQSGKDSRTPDICCDSDGNAFAVWIEDTGTNTIVLTSRYNGSVWNTPEVLSDPSQDAFEPQVCCDESGNAFAIWRGKNGTDEPIQSARFNGSIWLPFEDLSPPGGDYDGIAICCDIDGEAIAIWNRYNPGDNVIQSSHFYDSSWHFLGNVSSGAQNNTNSPDICCDPFGNAFATWRGFNGTNDIIQAAFFNGSSWEPSMDISVPGGTALAPEICCDADGNATVTWNRNNGSNFIVQTSFFNGSFWSVPLDLSEPGGSAFIPAIACNNQKDILIAWGRSNGTNSIVQATYNLDESDEPTINLEGFRRTNRFPSQSSVDAILNWSLPFPTSISSYQIYKNGILIATVSGTQTSYKDCNLNPCQSYNYMIIGINEDEEEILSETITI